MEEEEKEVGEEMAERKVKMEAPAGPEMNGVAPPPSSQTRAGKIVCSFLRPSTLATW